MKSEEKFSLSAKIEENPTKKLFLLIVVVILNFLLPYIAFQCADYFGLLFEFDQFSIQWDYVHHLIQMLLALLIIVLPIWSISLADWGLRFNDRSQIKRTLKSLGKFTIGYIIFLFIGKLIYQIILGWPSLIDFPLTTDNVIGKLIFRFTMPGLSEEILFRGLIMGILLIEWKRKINIGRTEIPSAGIIAAVLFTLAHIGISWIPFGITYYDPMQLCFAFVFGIYYSILLVKTKSLLAPILAHNIIDGFGTIIDILLSLIAP